MSCCKDSCFVEFPKTQKLKLTSWLVNEEFSHQFFTEITVDVEPRL